MSNQKSGVRCLLDYYTPVGSYDGAVKIKGRWTRAQELNRIDKRGWRRRQGPPTAAIIRAMREQPPIQATELFGFAGDTSPFGF